MQTGTTEGNCVQTLPPSPGQAMKTEGHCGETIPAASEQATFLLLRKAAFFGFGMVTPRVFPPGSLFSYSFYRHGFRIAYFSVTPIASSDSSTTASLTSFVVVTFASV